MGQNQKPNIIYIMTDDQSSIPLRDSDNQNQSRPFGFNGDSKVHTPIIDDLASKGIVFNNAFVSSSICSPSRYSILTGKYAGRSEGTSFLNNYPLGKLGRIANNIELEKNKTNLPKQLQAAGYKTAFVGKSHVIEHNLMNNYTAGIGGFQSYAKTDDPYNTEVSDKMVFNHDKWVELTKEYGFDYVDAFYAANLRELKNDALNVHNVEYKNKAVLDLIENSGDDPFFIYYSETIPHGPSPYWSNNNDYYAGLDADINITAEGVLNQDYSYLPTRNQIKTEVENISGKDPRHAWMRWFDHAVGAVVNKLIEKGKLNNTLIIITSDHGDLNNGKSTNYEGGIKVPLMMYWPDGISNSSTYNELVQNIDFAPTFLDIAGVDISNSEMDGKSLKEVITNNSTAPIHENLFFELGYSRAIRTKDWKYVTVRYNDATNTQIANGETFNGPNGTQVPLPYYVQNVSLGSLSAASYPLYHQKDQLFDLINDPYETTNLFNQQAVKASEMRNLLREKLLLFPDRPYQEFTDISVDLNITDDTETSIVGKILSGYQGWFNAEGDGADLEWKHYRVTVDGVRKFEPGFTSIDFWPDTSEFDEDEKYDTPFTHIDGRPANVFTSANPKTVNRHFKWMNDYNIDGVFVQRFNSNLKANAPKLKANNNVVFDNAIAGAIANNRLLSIMYDMSGSKSETVVEDTKQDWRELVDKHGLNNTDNKHLLTYKQKPIVAIWGVGFSGGNRQYSLEDVEELINFFKNDPVYGGCAVLLGVPTNWRTLDGDAVSDTQLHDLIKSADIVHPWTVGRYNNLQSANEYRSKMQADKAWCDIENLLYMPVVFPGFSWQNLKKAQGVESPLNSIPRLKGNFLWRQFHNAIAEGAETIYVAMFDEMDEGTCIFKVEDNPPSGESQFTNYEGLPNDYYLWLTGKAGEMLRNEISLNINQPTYPGLPDVTSYYVGVNGDDSNTGTSPGTAFSTVNKAYGLAQNGNDIYISGSVVHNAIIRVQKSLSFWGTNNATLSPNADRVGTDRLFHISRPNLSVSFSDITFKDNINSSINGGAMNMNANSNLNLTNCIFDGNSTGGSNKAGGGLFFSEGNVQITNSIFKNNIARGNGGAISASGEGVLSITGSLFLNNIASNLNNTAGDNANGGAINVFSDDRRVLISSTTFYNNTANLQGGGLYFSGTNANSLLSNVTVFDNKVTLPSAENSRGGGVRIEGNRPFEIKNSLFYGNNLGDATNSESDINTVELALLTLTNSLSGDTRGITSADFYSTSIIDVDLTSSNLRFNETSGKVEYDTPNAGDDSPINFGSDGNDAGAWNSGFVLSIDDLTISEQKFSIYYNKNQKELTLFNSLNEQLSIEIYNLLGAKVLATKNITSKESFSVEALKTGIYILKATSIGSSFSKKFIIH